MLEAFKNFILRKWTFSDYFLIFGLVVATLVQFFTDPDAGVIQLAFGAGVVAKMSALPAIVYGVAALWLSRRALFDYLNLKSLAVKAGESSIGAALMHVAVALTAISISIVVVGLLGYFGK